MEDDIDHAVPHSNGVVVTSARVGEGGGIGRAGGVGRAGDVGRVRVRRREVETERASERANGDRA